MTTQIRQENGISILKPDGKIIGKSVSEFRKVLLSAIEASDAPCILINFEDVSIIGSSGLGVLLEARAAVIRKQGRVAAVHVGANIKNLIVLSRIVNTLEHFKSEEAAVTALSA